MEQQPLSDLLRAETRHAHRSLDHHPALSSLVSPEIDEQTYGSSLERFYRSWVPLETAVEKGLEQFSPLADHSDNNADWFSFCIQNYHPRRYALARDLESLGVSPVTTWPVHFRFGTMPELVGGLYVYLGAQMGGKFIGASLARHLPGAPREFFDTTHSDLSTFWQAFRCHLDRFSDSPEDIRAVIDSANLTFASFRQGLG